MIANSLLAVLCVGVLAPLALYFQSNSVPACCRRNGKHRCMMAMQAMSSTSSAPVFRNALPDCPYRSNPVYPPSARNATILSITSVQLLSSGVIKHGSRTVPLSFSGVPTTNRGPPVSEDDYNA